MPARNGIKKIQEAEIMVISGLQRSAIKALPYQYLRMAVEKALEGIPIQDALDFAYEEWFHHEEEIENKTRTPGQEQSQGVQSV